MGNRGNQDYYKIAGTRTEDTDLAGAAHRHLAEQRARDRSRMPKAGPPSSVPNPPIAARTPVAPQPAPDTQATAPRAHPEEPVRVGAAAWALVGDGFRLVTAMASTGIGWWMRLRERARATGRSWPPETSPDSANTRGPSARAT